MADDPVLRIAPQVEVCVERLYIPNRIHATIMSTTRHQVEGRDVDRDVPSRAQWGALGLTALSLKAELQ
jgi:hypothetical protein